MFHLIKLCYLLKSDIVEYIVFR